MELPDPPHGRRPRVVPDRRDRTADGSGESAGRDGRTVLADGSGDPGDSPETVTKDFSEFGPAEFRREAEEFAAAHEDRDFDFTLDSLERLDEYAAAHAEVLGALGTGDEEGFVQDATGGFVLRFGSYFGEVLVRAFDGEWGRDGGEVYVALPAGDYTVEFPALNAALVAIRDEPVFAEVADDLRETVEGAEAGDLDPDAIPPREEMRAEAAELVEFWSEYDLDYSVVSLPRLDALVDGAWGNDRFRDAEYGGDRDVDLAYTGHVRELGSYFGEVLVRDLDAEWVQEDGTAVEIRGADGDAEIVDVFEVAEESLTGPSSFAATYESTRRSLGVEDAESLDIE